MIGFGRVITDFVTFAYLTDVYVDKEHQGKGLGKWMNSCLNEVITTWPYLRRLMLLASSIDGCRLYEQTYGVKDSRESSPKLFILEKVGPGFDHVKH
jgi:hypothetical protein